MIRPREYGKHYIRWQHFETQRMLLRKRFKPLPLSTFFCYCRKRAFSSPNFYSKQWTRSLLMALTYQVFLITPLTRKVCTIFLIFSGPLSSAPAAFSIIGFLTASFQTDINKKKENICHTTFRRRDMYVRVPEFIDLRGVWKHFQTICKATKKDVYVFVL